jgi:integrase/recombinase XerD
MRVPRANVFRATAERDPNRSTTRFKRVDEGSNGPHSHIEPLDGRNRPEAVVAYGAKIKISRDRAILSTLLFHALRREELCKLKVRDFLHARKGVPHLKLSSKGGKTRYLPLHPGTNGLINDYLDAAGHGADENGALFRPIRNNRTGGLDHGGRCLQAGASLLGFEIGAHALRATAATNALDHQADIAKVQEWLGHTNVATTRIYDHRRTRPEDSPTFKVAY